MGKLAQSKINVLNEFEARADDWSFVDLEKRLSGNNYHQAKELVYQAYKEGEWPKVVKHYLQDNFRTMGSFPGKFSSIGKAILEADEE